MTGNVLIVDDDRSMAETLTKAMSRRGFVVTWKTSASDALKLPPAVGVTQLGEKPPSQLSVLGLQCFDSRSLCLDRRGLRFDLCEQHLDLAFQTIDPLVGAAHPD
jgi:CheY-like chemotaxis protein